MALLVDALLSGLEKRVRRCELEMKREGWT